MKQKLQAFTDRLRRKLRRDDLESLVITDDNLAEHRAAMIKRGKKLKYPIQVSKKRVLAVSILIALVAALVTGILMYNALYRRQETGNLYYSVTKILPLPVAKVDGETVRYSDYLRRARGDIYYLVNREHRTFKTKDAIAQLNYLKRQDLTTTEKATLGVKLARDNGISYSDDDVDARIKQMREADDVTEAMFAQTLNEYYGWTVDDYRVMLKGQMLNEAVNYKMDTDAKKKIDSVKAQLDTGADFAAVAEQHGETGGRITSGAAIDADLDDRDPTGIAKKVSSLEVNAYTGVERVALDSDYYYYIAQLTAKNDKKKTVSYRVILVKLNYLNDAFKQAKSQGKVVEYIKL